LLRLIGDFIIYKAHIVELGPNRYIGFILNISNTVKPSVYLNTSIKSFNDAKATLIETDKVSNIEKTNPEFLEKWANILEQMFMGEDQNTSNIPLDLSDYTPKQAKVIDTVHKKIPVNEFYSYSDIADMAGFPNAQRFVGSTMKICRQYPIIPCKRVKNAQWIKRLRKPPRTDSKMRTPRTPL
jgi:O6-methylguanine-DNA--protein-cysteine methyltransferase